MTSIVLLLISLSLYMEESQSYLIQRKYAGARLTPLLMKNKIDCSVEKLKEQDRYVCTEEGEIKCLSGWLNKELKCVIPDCSFNGKETCLNGRCIAPHTCACDIGWEGPLCDVCVTMPNCEHGTCSEALGCDCEEGWEGYFCDIPKCNANCSISHGFCNRPGECECMFGWTGEGCNECQKLDSCVHGTCKEKPFECICDDGFSGPNCDIHGCDCVRGTCNDDGTSCVCPPGWYGKRCDICLPNLNICSECEKNVPWTCKEGSEYDEKDTTSFEDRFRAYIRKHE